MIVIAACVDGAQMLLSLTFFGMFVTPFITACAGIMFALWFSHHGITMMDPKRALAYGATLLGEVIPPFNMLPIWTLSVCLTLFFVNKSREEEQLI